MLEISAEQQVLFKILKGDHSFHLDDVNPDRLFSLFQRHRLFPLASEIVNLLDEKEREKWQNAIHVRTIRTLHQTSALSNLVSAFNAEGIEAIPLKGPVLAHSLYGNIGDRHSVDLDILIRGEKIERIIDVAEGLGFSLRFPKAGLSFKQWKYYFSYKKDIGLFNKDQGIFVELHTGIDNHELLNEVEENPLWKELMEYSVGGSQFHIMNHESNFLYLAYHGALHQYTRLFWLRDVAEALGRWKLDHQKILENAKSLGIERLLGVSLKLSKEYFTTEIPEEYQKFLQENDEIIQRLKRNCIKRILGPENPSFNDKIARHYYYFLLKPGLYYKWVVIKSLYHRRYIGKFLGGH